jgi:hypothetical protein
MLTYIALVRKEKIVALELTSQIFQAVSQWVTL